MRETIIETGTIRGIACGWPGITAFYGIPYAAPPVGNLRWRPPRSAQPWEGVRDCARPGPRCPQPGVGPFYEHEFYPVEEPMDEDCLYLNVWTPAASTEERLPVIFWVHGGGFLTGYGHSAHFDGEHFARQGVILVTINYRLNIFGWMVHPELAAESEYAVSGNYGLLDQIAALAWTRRNIAAFGGDPENITIAGQSAGAMSVQALLMSPLTEGMAKRAILQSGGGITPHLYTRFPALRKAEARTDLSLLGVSSIREARALPWQALLSRWAASMPSRGLQRTPVVDGRALPASIDELARSGAFHHIPCLIGYTAKEGLPAAASFAIWKEMLNEEYGEERANEFLRISGGETGFDAYNQRHYSIHCRAGAESWALTLERQGIPAYVYCFDRDLPGDGRGSFHASDLWYVFKTFMRGWRPWTGTDYELADACSSYWAGFAKTGVPQSERFPKWTPYTETSPNTMRLGDQFGMMTCPDDPCVTFRREFLMNGKKGDRNASHQF